MHSSSRDWNLEVKIDVAGLPTLKYPKSGVFYLISLYTAGVI